ncbi:hypothetical protein GEMRC1_007533 [Eukaryota sp. GEM-RC1]
MEVLSSFKLMVNSLDTESETDLDDSSRKLLAFIVIKCADISNPYRQHELAYTWSLRAMEEFYRQGDRERALGLPISAFYDRQHPQESKCQVGFIDFLVSPLYEQLYQLMPDSTVSSFKQLVANNRQFWVSVSDDSFGSNRPKIELSVQTSSHSLDPSSPSGNLKTVVLTSGKKT